MKLRYPVPVMVVPPNQNPQAPAGEAPVA
jgi:hypothetical protein